MTVVRVSSAWLALREPADAAARAADLVAKTHPLLPGDRPLQVRDLACGTGSMLRWLAPRLPGPQQWVCYDLDADLLAAAASEADPRAAEGAPVAVEVRQRDVTRLGPAECAGAALITTSALLDLLTAQELERLVATCVAAGCPALLTLSVTGQVALWPPHPFDADVGAAFNAHQRRISRGRGLLGPDAVDVAAGAFRKSGYHVATRPSPWRLAATPQASTRALTHEWFCGWWTAACEQRPELQKQAPGYAERRLADIAAGGLRLLVDHQDLLAVPVSGVRCPANQGAAGR